MDNTKQYFSQFLENAFEDGHYATDDVIAFLLPLFEEVLSFHESEMVGPFDNPFALFITNRCLDIDENFAHPPKFNADAVNNLLPKNQSQFFEVVAQVHEETDIDGGTTKYKNLQIHENKEQKLEQAAYIKGYTCFEQMVGHHDAQTDIFCLGLILGSISLGLNLEDKEDLETFVNYRKTPVFYNSRIHPTISNLITEMTELDRSKRAADLYEIIHQLKHYRDYDPEKQTDLSRVAGWVQKDLKERSQFVLHKLKNRLFDTSRRNRLLYYKPNIRFVNLTVSSVPMVLHYQSIRPDQLFTWNADITQSVIKMKEIPLNKYLRFEDHLYLSSSLDKIRTESQRDVQEFGFSQLKMVIAFLNWHNLKEDKNERIQSPLLLIPAELKKTKRIKEDQYSLKVLDNEAEVNPVLANQLKELYGIKLPDFVSLSEMSLEQFYNNLKAQIDAANQGIKLTYTDKPKIKLIHSVAKQTVSNYKKRLRKNGRSQESYKNIPYSYQQEHFKPLGLEIFRQYIEPKAAYLEFLINEDIKLSSSNFSGENTKNRSLYSLAESEENPYSWDFDICNVVLGNFNYKKMSLVRDYNAVIDNKIQHDVFDALFSNEPKNIQQVSYNLNAPEDWNHVITADPTQTQAILHSRSGESYIIQGPPGTGKSQTITNLIADYIAQGKNILFVCEKRAALDVVFHRLKQNGLDELCCYIHDSQSDKREFVKNLKATYEDFTKNRMDLPALEQSRKQVIEKLKAQIAILDNFHSIQNQYEEKAGVKVRELISKIIELHQQLPVFSANEKENLPYYNTWNEIAQTVENLGKALEDSGAENVFSDHPISKLREEIILSANPILSLSQTIQKAHESAKELQGKVLENNIDSAFTKCLEDLKILTAEANELLPLAKHQNLDLLDFQTFKAKQFDTEIQELRKIEYDLQFKQKETTNWKQKFQENELDQAIEIAQKHEKSFLKFLNGSWRKLKKQMDTDYDFQQHQIKPAISQVLATLKEEYRISNKLNSERRSKAQQYHAENIESMVEIVQKKRRDLEQKETKYLLQSSNAEQLIIQLHKIDFVLQGLEQQLNACLYKVNNEAISTILDDIESIQLNMEVFQELLPILKDFAQLPENVKSTLREYAISPQQLQALLANRTLEYIYSLNLSFATIDQHSIQKCVHEIQSLYKQLLKYNAEKIRASVRNKFLEHVDISNMAVSQLSPAQKEFKKTYNEGRKILENEFGKSMRYKSIRELSTKQSGVVLKDLKPVWLMSPLSVSDSLPLTTDFFDVVIFDEASQVTLEEGIPALYRSKQTIIVGDDKQMPPTNFFSANAKDPDDLETVDLSEDDELLSADADSLLVQGARKLNSTMLSWHYRSQYETLISYSNHAFYNADLLTIPDKAIHHGEKAIIQVEKPEDASKYSECLYDRSVSYHYLTNSVYEKRKNEGEAQYIAFLIRDLLQKKKKESIGIVAFSQEQQYAIEDAITQLAQEDKSFEMLLEEAYARTEEEQFVGLIIKNLENIQGDERDIIIMSVCYGFDSKKKMIMNFGPINKKGGEKRLNVLFSRAKKHMAVVSSIHYHQITNEYNEGANYFRRFLQYAENVSAGNMQMARSILDGLALHKNKETSFSSSLAITKQIKARLEQKGYEIAENVGQSGFKCSLAVKINAEDQEYTLGILIDDEQHYNNNNLVEQYYQRPAILKSFGWKYVQVFSKDWLQDAEKVMQTIEKGIRDKETPEEEVKVDLPPVTTVQTLVLPTANNRSTNTEDNPTQSSEITMEYYECTSDSSNKFWAVALQENKMIVRFGKIGTKGQTQVKTFETPEKAEQEKQKAIREKLSKGYFLKEEA